MTAAATIPASYLVQSNPSVLAPGGALSSLNAVFITNDPSIPIGTVQPFAGASAVQSWFGPAAQETLDANIYFSGFVNCTQLPTTLYFAQFNTTAVAAYVRGANVSAYSLAQIQAFSGTISVVVNGSPITTSNISLAAATSFSNAASIISSALGAQATCTFDALRQAFVITSPTTGSGSTIAYPTDGSLSVLLLMTAATGGAISQGAAPNSPAGVMASIIGQTQNFGTYMTVAEQTFANKIQFAQWNQTQNQTYLYVCQDSNVAATGASAPPATTFGPAVAAYQGVAPVYDPTGGLCAAFICGAIASINLEQLDGYTDISFKSNALLTPAVTNLGIAQNLDSNGYSSYLALGTATQQFQFLYPASVSGTWSWIDEFIAQIVLNAGLVNAAISLMTSVKSLPNTPRGDNLIRAALMDPILEAVNFGSIENGVTLSQSQIAQLATQAGVDISAPLMQQGWYLQIVPATPLQRQNRGPRQVFLWYTNGGGVHTMDISSIFVL